MEADAVIDKAKKLMGFTEDSACTENEARVAAEKLQQLLDKHQLSKEDVKANIKVGDIEEIDSETGYKKAPPWLWQLAQNIAIAYNCKLIVGQWCPEENGRTVTKVKYIFIGESIEALVASYFFDTLYFRLYQLCDEKMDELCVQGRSRRNAFRNAFIVAASTRIRDRLIGLRDTKRNTDKTYNALVVNKGAAVKKYIEENFPYLYKLNMSRGQQSLEGHHYGKQAGEGIRLMKGVKDCSGLNTGLIE